MNRRTFIKGVGLSLLACVVPNIVKVEEEKQSLVMGVDVAKNSGEDIIEGIVTGLKKDGEWIYSKYYPTHYNCQCWLADYFPQKEKLVVPTSNKRRQALAQIIKDAEDELGWTAYINKMTMISLTEEKDGLYYELARSPLYPNPNLESKFDGISHLIDKDG